MRTCHMAVSLVFLGWALQPSFWRLRAWGIFGDSGGTYDQVLGGNPPIFLYVSASCLKNPQALDLQKLNCGAHSVQSKYIRNCMAVSHQSHQFGSKGIHGNRSHKTFFDEREPGKPNGSKISQNSSF